MLLAMLGRKRAQPKTVVNPVFWPDELRRAAGQERYDRIRTDPESVDLLVWNVFQALETHADQDWLAYRLEAVGGSGLRPPLRTALWTGRDRQPHLRSSPGAEPIEAPVRIETPDVVVLIAVATAKDLRADGLAELIPAGEAHARRLGKRLAVGVLSDAGTPTASAWADRVRRLREQDALAAALHQASWQQMLKIFEAEVDYLQLGGQPVRGFLEHCRARKLL
jgi:hypothetical protein